MRRDIPHVPAKGQEKLQTESPLSPYRAFVVQFHTETEVARGQVSGRVEHVVSGQATHFQTVAEFLACIARLLDEGRGQSAEAEV